MYNYFGFFCSGIIFGATTFYYYKEFKFGNINFIDLSNSCFNKSTQTDNIVDLNVNKSTQIDEDCFLKDNEEIIEKSPGKYKWFII